nr:siderophore biosynthesis protein IucC [Bacteriovorax sp. HI3]
MNDWLQVNLNLLAKTLGELSYEQILKAEEMEKGKYRVRLQSGAEYTFCAWMGIWDHLRVDAQSIKKTGSAEVSAATFFIDAQADLEMDDIVLGNFLEEMHNSLYSDITLLKKQKNISAEAMSNWSGEKVQACLNGHPKILLSKGRVGWGTRELSAYAPENEMPVTLFWVAIKKDILEFSFDDQYSMTSLLEESLNKKEMSRLFEVLKEKKLSFDEYIFLPLHPWQWERFVKIQYMESLAKGEMVELGFFGDEYLPQISIRTLSNISRPEKVDVKLPLTILNTSAIRGIPARYISIGAKLSRSILSLCQEDQLLKSLNTDVLVEKGGASFEHKAYAQVKNSPYRYKEYLGAIWRESTVSKLAENEQGILTGSLFFQDLEKKSLIGAYIEKSKLTKEEWLREYFKFVIIPLYHLQVKYGLGLVSHGQNIILKMKNYAPVGIILKDFQGDLRLSNDSVLNTRADFKELAARLDKMPKEYLIHDLLTGHLVTVLRFVSEVMEESDGFPEIDFYQILAEVVENYINEYSVPNELSFLNEKIHRVLVNKVRFKIGYGDSSERPKPMVGVDLLNPLYLGLKHKEEING